MKIQRIDHIVLTVADVDESISFYTNILGFKAKTFGDNRKALLFGNQKINLQQKGKEIDPKADKPTGGSADICFIADTGISEIEKELKAKNIAIIEGIVERDGALGKIKSIYFRDPDMNLIEVSNYNN